MNIPVDLTLTTGVIVTLLVTVVGWVQLRWRALSDRVDGQAERAERHSDRIVGLEAAIRNLPGRDELHRMEVSVTQMAGEMKAVGALMAGQRDLMQRMEAVVARHEDHLLTKR